MRNYDEYKETTNREVFNKVHKNYVLGCSYCAPNKGCNKRGKCKWYVARQETYIGANGREKKQRSVYPNWKLVSKNRKQWMDKKLKKEFINYRHRPYEKGLDYEIKW